LEKYTFFFQITILEPSQNGIGIWFVSKSFKWKKIVSYPKNIQFLLFLKGHQVFAYLSTTLYNFLLG